MADDLRTRGNVPIPGRGTMSFPSLDGQSEWVIDAPPHGPAIADDRDPDTGALIEQLPASPYPSQTIAAVTGGLLTVSFRGNDRSSEVAVTEPNLHGTRRVITRSASADSPVMAAAGVVVAWQGPGQCGFCQLKLTSLLSGHTRPVIWHPPQRFLCDQGALSPNDRWLAVAFGCPRPDVDGPAPVLLVNVATAHGHLVPGSANLIEGPPVWSSDGRWVIWEQSAGPHQATLRAYHPGSRRPHAFAIPRNPGGLLQALPTPDELSGPSSYSGP